MFGCIGLPSCEQQAIHSISEDTVSSTVANTRSSSMTQPIIIGEDFYTHKYLI